MAKKLKSVLTHDMDHCMITGSAMVERHHIFGGVNRSKSEKYGFVVPLRYDLHPNGANFDRSNPNNLKIDGWLKQMAQEYFEEHYGTREFFIQEFGKSYI